MGLGVELWGHGRELGWAQGVKQNFNFQPTYLTIRDLILTNFH